MASAGETRERLPLVVFEDDHVLVIHKPAGINTHAPAPFAGEGIYDWLRHRNPRWATLAIIHRLDKDTSGLMVFAKTSLANRSLTQQFTERSVRKQYLLLTDRSPPKTEFSVRSYLVRSGCRYESGSEAKGGELAETHFSVLATSPAGQSLVTAEPRTGRTHQIRVHAAENGFPILGDTLYGGSPGPRMCLHARQLEFRHPVTGAGQVFTLETTFPADARTELRQALIDPALTDACRLAHGAADGPELQDCYVDRFGEFLLCSTEHQASAPAVVKPQLARWMQAYGLRGVYFKELTRHIRGADPTLTSPLSVLGDNAPDSVVIRENGVRFEIRFNEGYSVGLFLDQRDNRRRVLTNHLAAGFPLFPSGPDGAEVLNTFAYTCAFSVCAAMAGAHTTSLDLSKKYLAWGQRNFTLNALDPARHDFIYGDTFDWLRRLGKKRRQFDLILLDPPTFSQSKSGGIFRAEHDYGKLVAAAIPLLKPNGVLFASTNAATVSPEAFLHQVKARVQKAQRGVAQQHYAPQPPDFPVTRAEPAYLKTVWLRIR